ncbi:MAG: hypothetical protein PVJ02_15255 [Gemmatimonadota bacterium]|jgi:hypothetical protein
MARSVVRLALAALVVSGCYTYTPASLDEVSPQQDVRLRLSTAEAERLEPFRRSGGRTLDGKVTGMEGDSVTVKVEAVSELRGARVETLYQYLHVSSSDVVDVELRELDKGRTYLVTGAGVVAAAALVISRIGGNGGSSGPDQGGGPFEAVVPLLSLRLPFRVFSLVGGH